MGKRSANTIDRHVAEKIRARREQVGLSQVKLGAALGVMDYLRGGNGVTRIMVTLK